MKCALELSPVFYKLINKSHAACFLSCLKSSSRFPVFKNTGKNTDPPPQIIVLQEFTFFYKLPDTHINAKFGNHLNTCNRLSNKQYGSHSFRYTADVLTVITGFVHQSWRWESWVLWCSFRYLGFGMLAFFRLSRVWCHWTNMWVNSIVLLKKSCKEVCIERIQAEIISD